MHRFWILATVLAACGLELTGQSSSNGGGDPTPDARGGPSIASDAPFDDVRLDAKVALDTGTESDPTKDGDIPDAPPCPIGCTRCSGMDCFATGPNFECPVGYTCHVSCQGLQGCMVHCPMNTTCNVTSGGCVTCKPGACQTSPTPCP